MFTSGNKCRRTERINKHTDLGTAHAVGHAGTVDIEILLWTTANRKRCGTTTARDYADARGVGHAGQCQKHPDTDTARCFECARDNADEPLAHACEGENKKDEALDKDGRQCDSVRNGAAARNTNNLVGKVGVEPHAGSVFLLAKKALFEDNCLIKRRTLMRRACL